MGNRLTSMETMLPYGDRVDWQEVRDSEVEIDDPTLLQPGDIVFWEVATGRDGQMFTHGHTGIVIDSVKRSLIDKDSRKVSSFTSTECLVDGCGEYQTLIIHASWASGTAESEVLDSPSERHFRILRIHDINMRRRFVELLDEYCCKKSEIYDPFNSKIFQLRDLTTFGLLQSTKCPVKTPTSPTFRNGVGTFLNENLTGYKRDSGVEMICSHYVTCLLQSSLYLLKAEESTDSDEIYEFVYNYVPVVAGNCSPSSLFWSLLKTCKYDNLVLRYYSWLPISRVNHIIRFDPGFQDKQYVYYRLLLILTDVLNMFLVGRKVTNIELRVLTFTELSYLCNEISRRRGIVMWGSFSVPDSICYILLDTVINKVKSKLHHQPTSIFNQVRTTVHTSLEHDTILHQMVDELFDKLYAQSIYSNKLSK